MARFNMLALVLIVILIFGAPSLEARKLLSVEEKKVPSQLEDNLVPSALPKGSTAPPSSPSGKGHAMLPFPRSLTGVDQFLESVPSPGVGH
ncbi:hypothetical protein ACSBR2_028023 [Camellia fascicularis]